MEVSDASNPWVTKLVVKVWMHCSHRSAVSHCFHNTKRNACSTKKGTIFGLPERVSFGISGAQRAAICSPSSRRSVSNTVPGVKWRSTMEDETPCKVAGISSGVSGRESE